MFIYICAIRQGFGLALYCDHSDYIPHLGMISDYDIWW